MVPNPRPESAQAEPVRIRLPRGDAGRGLVAAGALSLAACAGEPVLDEPEPLGNHIPIEYPLEMWDQGIEGETVLQVWVNELGEVDSVAVVETSGHVALDSAAAEGARAMRFNPGSRGGREVPVRVRIPVQFSKQAGPQL